MRFVVIYLVLAIIIYVRGICPVIHDRRKRLWCLLAVLPGAFFPSVTRFIGGSMVAPDLPVWVMYAGSIFQNFNRNGRCSNGKKSSGAWRRRGQRSL